MKKQLLFLKLKATQFFLLFLILLSFISIGSKASAQSVAGDYSFSNIADSNYSQFLDGTPIGANNWDNFLPLNVNIGFNFYFNGSTYISCYINANGFLTFGTTAAATDEYSPISSARGYDGAIAAFARDLYYGTNNSAYKIRYKTTGIVGSRVFTVQWRDAKRWNHDGKFNFQIRLYEGSNTVEIHYGANSEGTASNTANNTDRPVQVGLRGATNSDFNNRTTTTNWDATTAGSTNNATNSTTATIRPIPNSIYRWTLTKFTASSPLFGSGTWTAPCGPTEITVEAWGAGGAGGKATNIGPNGGGGGGAYSKKTFTVTAGDSFAYTVGNGGSGSGANNTSRDGIDTWFGSTSFLLAKAGTGVRDDKFFGGLGGQKSASVGDVTNNGGSGGTPANSGSHSGGGGGAAKVDGDGSNGGVNIGGASAFPGGSGGNGTRNDDGFFNFGYGSGNSANNFGGGGGGGRSAFGFIDQDGGNGAPGYMLLSYSYPNTGAPPPVTAISVLSSDPTTDIGCVNNSVTLQASGGNIGAGVSTLWVKGPDCPTFAYIQEFMGTSYTTTQTTAGTLTAGNRRFRSTGVDPTIDMQNLFTSTITPAVHKYMAIRYRVVSGGGGLIQIYIKKSGLTLDDLRMVSAPLNSDGNWHIMNIDMSVNSAWNNSPGGNITGWRFDYATLNNTVMDLDYLALSSHPIEENTNADDTQITVDASDENTVFRSLRIADQAALCNGAIPYTSCIPVTLHRSDKTFTATSNNNWDNAGNWSFAGIPDNSNCVFINNSRNLLVNTPSAAAKSIHVAGNSSLTITPNNALTVTNSITNLGNGSNFIVESDANLIQVNPSKTINTGNITAERKVTNLRYQPGQHVDYVYWSSPVSGQITKGTAPGAFSPGTNPAFFYDYRESNDRFYSTTNSTFVPGKGYAVRAEEDQTSTYTKTYTFKGTVNNGDFTFPIMRSPNTGSGGTVVHGYNLVGNPYPSNIDFDQLFAANSSLIYNTAWFWTNATFQQYQGGSGYTGNNYAIYNGTGGNNATSTNGIMVTNGIVKVGQGFLVQKKSLGVAQDLMFNNSMRLVDAGTFYYKGAVAKNRFTLQLTSPDQLVNSQLIGYVAGATDEYEQDYDAEAFSLSSNLFYSALDGKRLLIQGKSDAFTTQDKVILGANFFQNGTYSIAMANKEGIFSSGQTVYLKDNLNNTVTNLSQGIYTFTSNAGESSGRFEIIYQPETVLATDGTTKEELIIYKESGDFVVKAQSKKITNLEVFDMSGRMIMKMKPNNTKAIIPANSLSNGVYLLKVDQGGVITSKKIIR